MATKCKLFAVFAMLLFGNPASAAPIIVPASDPGNTPGDAFDISTGVVVTSNTPIFPNAVFDVQNIFGAKISSSGQGFTRFADRGTGQVDTVFFTTPSPVTISGYHLYLVSSNEIMGARNAELTSFQLLAGGNPVSTVPIIPLGGTYLAAYGSEFIEVTDTFANPVTASSFELIATGNDGQFTGPRIVELDAITATPEPASLSLFAIGMAGVAGCVWRKRKQQRNR